MSNWKEGPKSWPYKVWCHLDIFLFFFFFCSFGVASDTDHGFAAKLNQAIMACISILSHVAKYLYPHILLSAPYQSPLLSITCSNNSVQRCAVGQSRPAVTEVRCITSSGKIFSLRKACVMADISALDSWVWRPSFVFSRAGMWSCFRGVSVASRASSNTSKQIQPGWGAFPCRTGSRRGMDRGGGRQAIVSFALEVNCSLKIKHPASCGRDREPLTWSEETARSRREKMQEGTGELGKARGVYCFCTAQS